MDTPIFRTPDGQYLTMALFLETSYSDTTYTLYTTKRHDYEYNGKLYKSFPKLYLEIADPTEYQVATQLFDGWAHWLRIRGNNKFMPMIQALQDELEVKLRSEGVLRMKASAKVSESAAKWLADKGWEKNGMGRPTKERVQREAKKLQQVQDAVQSDVERIAKLQD